MIEVRRLQRFVPIWTALLALACLCPESRAENRKILQTERKIVIDGRLDEWQEIPSFPVILRPSNEEVVPSDDISVAVRFTFDAKRFYAAVEVLDDLFEFPSRSWRYGDGLLLTFIDPAGGNVGDRFVTFGFSQIKGRPISVLLNRDGTYFPPASLKDVDLEVEQDAKRGRLSYEISIPFSLLTPFRPFLQGSWGINLAYADRDGEEREVLQLYPDPGYDTELSHQRRGEIFDFVLRSSRLRPEMQGVMTASHYTDDAPKTLILGIQNPGAEGEWTLRYNLSSARVNRDGLTKFRVAPGRNRIEWELDGEEFPSAAYVLSVGVIDARGSLSFTQDNPFFVLNRSELEELAQKLDQAKAGELYEENVRFRNSFPSVELRLGSIDDFLTSAYPHVDMTRIHQEYVDLEFLVDKISEGKPALFLPGRIGRLAHRSEIDGSLQPYSVYVPDFYDGEEALPLYVTLHGSGVDERQTIQYVAQTLFDFRMRGKAGRFIVLAPQGRGLSDWYLGDAGTDVMECIAHVKTLYNIDEKRIMLDGFSMGGYGAWRLGLSFPEVFKAVVVRSGAVSPPPERGGENILELMRPGIPNSYFVVHGAKDNAVPVVNARRAAQKMKETGIDHRYVEIKNAAHSGYDKWDEILGWLKRKVGWEDASPMRKGPRKKRPRS
jgi:predicted esterase